MANDLVDHRRALEHSLPAIADLLRPVGLPVETFAQCAMILTERGGAKLRECSLDSWIASITSLAVVRLLPDGVTGQSFLLPFNRVATPVIGYKGFNTLAGRAGWTLGAKVVREGDEFDVMEGTDPRIHYRPSPLPHEGRKIIWAYAHATAPHRTPIISVMTIHEVLDVRNRAPGGKKPDSPWNDPVIGFPAMAMKTAKRRLGRDLGQEHAPHLQLGRDFHKAQALEEMRDEVGKLAWLDPRGQVVTEDGSPAPPTLDPGRDITKPQVWALDLVDFEGRVYKGESYSSEGAWRQRWETIIDKLRDKPARLLQMRDGNLPILQAAGKAGQDVLWEIEQATGTPPDP